jgi:hypothetical protein
MSHTRLHGHSAGEPVVSRRCDRLDRVTRGRAAGRTRGAAASRRVWIARRNRSDGHSRPNRVIGRVGPGHASASAGHEAGASAVSRAPAHTEIGRRHPCVTRVGATDTRRDGPRRARPTADSREARRLCASNCPRVLGSHTTSRTRCDAPVGPISGAPTDRDEGETTRDRSSDAIRAARRRTPCVRRIRLAGPG